MVSLIYGQANGLKVDREDRIIAADGRPINNPDDLISFLVFNTEVGQTITLTLIRDGQQLDVPLTLGQRP